MTLRSSAVAFLGMLLLTPTIPAGQNDAPPAPQALQRGTKTLTGCFFRGEAVNEYRFAATNGLIWYAVGRSKHMKMKPYIGHTVTIRAKLKPNPDDSKVSQSSDAVKRDLAKSNAGILTIIRVIRTGPACTQESPQPH